MFSFAVWDDRSKRLLLARDRLGIKPLYYRQDGESLAFASELKCLVDSSKRQINLSALSDFFTFAYVPGPDTIYQGVYELPPALTSHGRSFPPPRTGTWLGPASIARL